MRTCMFCGNRGMSREDAWPLWLLKRVGANGRGESVVERGRQEPRSWRVARAGVRVRLVCGECNNGWMSDLETRVKPVIEPLLEDSAVVLSTDDRKTLPRGR